MTTSTNRTPSLHHTFSVRISSAKMPNTCRGRYVHVGVIECWGKYPSALRETKSQTVHGYCGRLNDGTSDRCASAVALRSRRALRDRLERQYAERLAEGYVEHLAERCDEI